MSRARERAKVRPAPARIVIPDLQGLILSAALNRATEIGFALAVEGPPLHFEALLSSGRWAVARQEPQMGSDRFLGDTVVVVLAHDGPGGAGDREPRNPLPRITSDRALSPAELGEEAD